MISRLVTIFSYVSYMYLRAAGRHSYGHLDIRLHRYGTAQPAPFLHSLHFSFLDQSIFYLMIPVVLIRHHAY